MWATEPESKGTHVLVSTAWDGRWPWGPIILTVLVDDPATVATLGLMAGGFSLGPGGRARWGGGGNRLVQCKIEYCV